MNGEDPLRPARGCAVGLVVAGFLWVATFAVLGWYASVFIR